MSKKQAAPKAQECRDLFFATHEWRGNILWHEGERMFYHYDGVCWRSVPSERMREVIDEFLVTSYQLTHNISITTSVIDEVIAAISREMRPTLLRRYPADKSSSWSAFSDCDFNFQTFERHDHDPDNFVFHSFPFPLPPPNQPHPTFDNFLTTTFVDPETFETDSELVEFIADALAFYITPVNVTPHAIMALGSGSNGKSILLDLLQAIIGQEYITSLTLEDLGSRFGGADLIGKRLNVVAEDPAKVADVSKIKALISQDSVSLERKYEDRVKCRPTAKHIFSTNHEIRFENIDEATTRRIHIVKFHRTFKPPTDPRIDGVQVVVFDPNLIVNIGGEYKGKLVDEIPAIVGDLLARLPKLAASAYDLVCPQQILDAARETQMSSSSALEFFNDNYIIDRNVTTLTNCEDVYQAYLSWYADEGRSERFKLQRRQFWFVFNKNYPECNSTKKVYKDGNEHRTKRFIKPKSNPQAGQSFS